jgi:hypothetical protein
LALPVLWLGSRLQNLFTTLPQVLGAKLAMSQQIKTRSTDTWNNRGLRCLVLASRQWRIKTK